jgi:trimethylamine--corrinoid protein Co-methyltransferase
MYSYGDAEAADRFPSKTRPARAIGRARSDSIATSIPGEGANCGSRKQVMRRIEILSAEIREQIVSEAFALLQSPGMRVGHEEARTLLEEAGAEVDREREVARLPEALVRRALETVPSEFQLFDRDDVARVDYGGDAVQFDPGSSALNVLDPETGEHRSGVSADLLRLVQVAEMLPQFEAQSTAIVCSEIPKAVGDLYRLYLVLMHSVKPIVTGAFNLATLGTMIEMIEVAGGSQAPDHPRAVFDVCPSPPLNWGEFASGSLIQLARARVPAEIVSMPLAGATAPVTLAGSVVQHAAECMGSMTLHQLAQPGAPIVWGGAPSIFDMRHGTTPMGAMETAMIDAAYADVGKSFGMPTHAYMCASDAKTLDAQAGLESVMTALVGAQAGINMISGAGMLDFLACHSVEKLVLDAEAIAQVQRFRAGIQSPGATIATDLFAELGHRPDFLKLKQTRELFKKEHSLPSALIDRGSLAAWKSAGSKPADVRARERVEELLGQYERKPLAPDVEEELWKLVERAARNAGLDSVPRFA